MQLQLSWFGLLELHGKSPHTLLELHGKYSCLLSPQNLCTLVISRLVAKVVLLGVDICKSTLLFEQTLKLYCTIQEHIYSTYHPMEVFLRRESVKDNTRVNGYSVAEAIEIRWEVGTLLMHTSWNAQTSLSKKLFTVSPHTSIAWIWNWTYRVATKLTSLVSILSSLGPRPKLTPAQIASCITRGKEWSGKLAT